MRWIWIDKIVEFESGRRAVAVKNVSLAEEHVHDHFPGYPIHPPTLMIEGMAQTGGILVGHARQFAEKVILAKITRAELDELVVPGDQLIYHAEIDSISESAAVLKGGITGVLKTAHLAEAFGKNIELHITYSPFTNAAQIHLECALKNTLYHEYLGTAEMNRRWERAYGVREFAGIDDEGCVSPPLGPGVGVELDQELLGKPVEVL